MLTKAESYGWSWRDGTLKVRATAADEDAVWVQIADYNGHPCFELRADGDGSLNPWIEVAHALPTEVWAKTSDGVIQTPQDGATS